jgi:hypothetical protein
VCLLAWVKVRPNCPNCAANFNPVKKPNLDVMKRLQQIQIKCIKCEMTIPYSMNATHHETCTGELVICPFPKCDGKVKLSELDKHLTTSCKGFIKKCQKCGFVIEGAELHDCLAVVLAAYKNANNELNQLKTQIKELKIDKNKKPHDLTLKGSVCPKQHLLQIETDYSKVGGMSCSECRVRFVFLNVNYYFACEICPDYNICDICGKNATIFPFLANWVPKVSNELPNTVIV